MVAEIVISLFLLIGAVFALIGSLGLAKLPDFFTRLHAPTKATTLGLGGMLIAAALYTALSEAEISARPVLITLFLFMTAPVSAHLLARAGIYRRLRSRVPLPHGDAPAKRDE